MSGFCIRCVSLARCLRRQQTLRSSPDHATAWPLFLAAKAVKTLDRHVYSQVFCFAINTILFPLKIFDCFVGLFLWGIFKQIKIMYLLFNNTSSIYYKYLLQVLTCCQMLACCQNQSVSVCQWFLDYLLKEPFNVAFFFFFFNETAGH